MEFIEKHKALIITSLLMGIFILTLYNISMLRKQNEQAEMLVEIPTEDFLQQEEEKVEEVDPLQEDRKLIAAKRTHNAYNEDFEDPNDDFEERLKALTETSDEGTEGENEDLQSEEGEPITEENNESENKEEDTGTAADKKPAGSTVNNRNSSITYSLKNRKTVDLPNPVYTCNGSGKVVVRIIVNPNGYVIDTKINKKASTTRNECLFDNAMDYARQSLFTSSSLKAQKGTITYFFNYTE